MPSFLESVSDAASGRSTKEGDKKRKENEGKGANFQERLNSLLGMPKPRAKTNK